MIKQLIIEIITYLEFSVTKISAEHVRYVNVNKFEEFHYKLLGISKSIASIIVQVMFVLGYFQNTFPPNDESLFTKLSAYIFAQLNLSQIIL